MIDFCKTRLDVASRTLDFVDQILRHQGKTVEDFETFDEFINFLDKSRIRDRAGFNKNKRGYMEALKFAYSLKHNKREA